MSLGLLFVWIISVSVLCSFASLYVRRFGRPDALIALYVILVTFANLAAGKIIGFDLGFATYFAPATVVVFSVTFLLTDIVNERFGREETQRMIYIAIACQVAVIALSQLVLRAQGAPFFENQGAFEVIFGSVPRVVLASLLAFTISESADAYLFQWFRQLTKGKKLWMRNIFSSLPSMAIDSIIFTSIAFAGIIPLMPIIIGNIVIKWLVGVVDVPFMYLSRAVLGKSENLTR